MYVYTNELFGLLDFEIYFISFIGMGKVVDVLIIKYK